MPTVYGFFNSPFLLYFRLIHLFFLFVCHLPSPTHSAVDEVTRYMKACLLLHLCLLVY